MFVFNRDAVRELRRQLAPVVTLLSEDKERVVRLASYMRRGQAMIGGGSGGTSSALVKNEAKQSAAAATSATSSNNNVDDESSSVQLSAADCGEWLLGRVLGALLFLADKKNENNNNNDDDDANDVDDGEKKATNEVRNLLLASGVDEATVEQTVKELNWKVRRATGGCFLLFFAILFVANTRTTNVFMFLICCLFFVLTLAHARIHRQFVQNCSSHATSTTTAKKKKKKKNFLCLTWFKSTTITTTTKQQTRQS